MTTAAPASLETFFDRLRSAAPFTDNRVNGPEGDDVDVDTIHQQPFERLVALACEARDEQRGLGAVLWGEAGIGKSHLLARLSRWANQDKHACLVYLHNLQAGPETLPRSLLKAVLSILTWGRARQFVTTPLYRLVNAALREALEYDPRNLYSWPDAIRAYGNFVTRLSAHDPSRAALVDRTVYYVLFRFFRSAYLAQGHGDDERVARLAVRWLSGDFLDPAEARQLGLPPGRGAYEPAALADNQHVKQVLVALTRMALSRRQPFLLCFDQVDNLDVEQAAALARFLEALIDSSPNLLVVLAGVQATLVQWRNQKVIQDSAWDRLAQFEISLQRVTVAEGHDIVAARLRRFLEPFRDLEPVSRHVQSDDLFPLGEAWAEEFLADKIEVRPRDAINWARAGWRREQEALRQLGGTAWLAGWGGRRTPAEPAGPPTADQLQDAIDRKIDRKIREHIAQRREQPYTLAPNADNLAGLVGMLLEQAVQADQAHAAVKVARLPVPATGRRPPYDLIVRQQDNGGRTGLLFLATSSATAVAAALRRLVRDPDPPDRLLLVTDERQPLPLAARGQQYYDELEQRGDGWLQPIELSFEQYAALDALQAVVGLARSGDLEIELPDGQTLPVNDQEVMASHQRQGRYAAAAVLRDLLAAEAWGPRSPSGRG
ncbi:MAG TPA: AAA family ATPase [Gemmataceae bacterium]|jgi:type II secretory pathway predicted ATPase ExeA|nr:AAA family ATPase [Gemmataceae bacterium]